MPRQPRSRKSQKETVAIVGYGRFGKVLVDLLKDDFHLIIYNRSKKRFDGQRPPKDCEFVSSIKDIYKARVIFYAVSIRAFESVLRKHVRYVEDSHTLIDVLSVKTYPKTVFKKVLGKKKPSIILTHPMFGPDSSKNGYHGLPIMVDSLHAKETVYKTWKSFFSQKGLKVVEMTAEEHDQAAANSQGIAHFIGRLLEDLKFKPTQIDTQGAKKLYEVMEQTCHDTWELFTDLQTFNPYTRKMRVKVGESYKKIYNKLLPDRMHKDRLVVGIQGGKGSFNEEAARYYLDRSKVKDYELVYLYTTENVLDALYKGDIDRGQFAIHNSTGGVVSETVEAMSRYTFTIVEEFGIKIAHALMCRKDAEFEDLDTIMTHPQVLKQCKETLAQKYKNLKQTSGEGELIDHAMVGKALSEGTLDKNIAVMGSKVIAEIFDLAIIEDNLQDSSDNFTSFLWTKR